MHPSRPNGNGVPPAAPLERSGELEVLEAVVAGALEGRGGLVVVEGPAGIGKSRLLAEAAASAEFLGARPLRARATELEQSFAFGVALQLFEPALGALTPQDRALVLRGAAALAAPLLAPEKAAQLPGPGHDFSLIHGLHWLAANLAEDRPLLLILDDGHWADEPSLQFLAYLARRVLELPIALLIAARPGEPGTAGELLTALADLPQAQTLRPRALSPGAVGTLIEHAVGRAPDERFVAACERLTGGNPHLLSELLTAAVSEGLRATSADAERLTRLAPQGVLRAVAARLAALPDGAAALARAVAVLGDDAHLRHAAALAGLPLDVATRAADRLAAADVLRPGEPLAFRHPLTAAAVDADLPAAARAAAHLHAAELLRADGTPPERLATHLLGAPPTGAPWVVETLCAAADRALALGAPAIAAAQLRRALQEPPSPDERGALLVALGRAEARAGEPTAADRLAAAAALAPTAAARAETLRELARTRLNVGDHTAARAAYAEAIEALDGADPELRAHLRAEELVVAALDPAHRPDAAVAELLGNEHVGGTPGGRALLATLAVHELYAGAPRDRVLALADRALAGDAAIRDDGAAETTLFGIVLALFIGEELSRVDELLSRMIDDARRSGAVMAVASASYSRAWSRLIAGRVRDAIDDAQRAVDAGDTHGWQMFLAGAHGALTHALLDAGDADAAEEHLRQAARLLGEPEDVTSIQLLDARGRVHAVRGRHADAAADFLAAGDLAGEQRNPLLFATWRSNAGLSLARLGDRDRARSLVEDELELAHAFGAPRGMAVALRALGVIEGGALGLDLLHRSLEALDGSEAVLERMRCQVELGAALRRAGRRADAGRMLGAALETARELGAGAIERRADEELLIAGARAGQAARRGRAALSPGERRVAQLAATGLTNREIAEELFVTRKAVEWHLHNAFGKLGIGSRKDLPRALAVEE